MHVHVIPLNPLAAGVPLIVERGGSWTTKPIPQMEKKKFLCPSDITVGQFQSVIRKRLEIHSEQGLFLTVSNKFLPPSSALLSQIYAEYKDSDGVFVCYVRYRERFWPLSHVHIHTYDGLDGSLQVCQPCLTALSILPISCAILPHYRSDPSLLSS
ncbi:hypothetical protein BSLG_004478 [Batrachochytrium salamandrivorans]|nr:hypothetical protein BSLG_004478 [Batrachochytrium salamandrivorans]